MVKQRGARIPWLFAPCPADLALFHHGEIRSVFTDLGLLICLGLSTCLDVIWSTEMAK